MISAPRMATSVYTSHPVGADMLHSALRIIAERSTKGETRDLLLRDLTSMNKESRAKALSAMYFLVSNRTRTALHIQFNDVFERC
jgi:hypothetical protein